MSGFFPVGGGGGGGGPGTLISKVGPIGAPQATFDFTGIASTFNHLYLIGQIRDTGASGSALLTLNGDNGSNYNWGRFNESGTTITGVVPGAPPDTRVTASADSSVSPANVGSLVEVFLPWYSAATTFNRMGWLRTNRFPSPIIQELFGFEWANTIAINRVTLTSTATYAVGSVMALYGQT